MVELGELVGRAVCNSTWGCGGEYGRAASQLELDVSPEGSDTQKACSTRA